MAQAFITPEGRIVDPTLERNREANLVRDRQAQLMHQLIQGRESRETQKEIARARLEETKAQLESQTKLGLEQIKAMKELKEATLGADSPASKAVKARTDYEDKVTAREEGRSLKRAKALRAQLNTTVRRRLDAEVFGGDLGERFFGWLGVQSDDKKKEILGKNLKKVRDIRKEVFDDLVRDPEERLWFTDSDLQDFTPEGVRSYEPFSFDEGVVAPLRGFESDVQAGNIAEPGGAPAGAGGGRIIIHPKTGQPVRIPPGQEDAIRDIWKSSGLVFPERQ